VAVPHVGELAPASPRPGTDEEPPGGAAAGCRAEARGKFLYVGAEKVYVRGVTYGTFRPDERGDPFPSPQAVDRDFADMAASEINTVRTYTPPPRWLLDAAQRHGLLVLAGFAWEQHVAFLEGRRRGADIERRLRAAVRSCAGHPALLGWTIGNEIPAAIVRWYGRERVQRFLRRLYRAAKAEDPGALVTYVNFPPTEYLELPFLDFVCFNVYLEERERLEAYLGRLHNLAAERPLVMAEIGLDSRRNGEEAQARTLRWQIEAAFESGVAGAFVFAWTDEWYITHLDASGQGQSGSPIEDWNFGLTDRHRRPKPALTAVREAFRGVPIRPGADWPPVSVVVCSLNGERTLADTLEGAFALDYPDFEVIVVDDGSTDGTAAIAAAFGARLIRTDNHGLSSARNTGLHAAIGDIVAYLDDDARPDPQWLLYLVAAFRRGAYAGVGGPNLAPGRKRLVSDCVAAAPGGPAHVLLSDDVAEHIPGCNCAFLTDALLEVDGFDPRFRVAGDDVDLCWRLQDRRRAIGFAPAALVWHRPRETVRAYLRQQRGYGKAEAMLESKWPDRYNPLGHARWRGRLYGREILPALGRRTRIYHGTWNSGLFQSLYERPPNLANQLSQTPEWWLLVASLAVISLLGVEWWPLLAAVPVTVLAVTGILVQAALGGVRATFPSRYRGVAAWSRRGLTALLFLLQPLARLSGRVSQGLTLWRRSAECPHVLPRRRRWQMWSTEWRPPEAWISDVERAIRTTGAVTARGGHFDAWDLEIRGGLLGGARLTSAVEEHGAGLQMIRFRVVPRTAPSARVLLVVLVALTVAALLSSAWMAVAVLGACAGVIAIELARACGYACGAALTSRAPRPEPAHASSVTAEIWRANGVEARPAGAPSDGAGASPELALGYDDARD
jgi:glycosyltransferase involved in cell wall biosynthesis